MFRRTLVFSMVFVLALMALSGAASDARAQDKLIIGLLSDQTGALQQYGKELEQGFMLGLKYATEGSMEVAGRKLEVLVRDTQSNPATGASQARELIEKDGAEVLVGAPSSGVALQLQQVAADLDVILMAGPAASPAITGANFHPNTFRACRNTTQDFLALTTVLKDTGVKKVVILAADYDFGRSSAVAAEAAYTGIGLEIAQTIYAPLNTTDFTAVLQQVLASGADALQPIWAGDTSVALFKQIAELGVLDKMILITSFNSNPITKAASTEGEVGGIGSMVYHYTLPKNAINDWLVENHKADYNGEFPDLFTECGFATAQALVAALKATEGDTSTEKMIAALEGLEWEGPRGTYVMRASDHQVMLPIYIVRLVNLTDPEFKFYELVREVPAEFVAPPCALPEQYAERCKQ